MDSFQSSSRDQANKFTVTISAASREAVLGTVRGALRDVGTEGQTFFAVVRFLEATLAGERTRAAASSATSASVRTEVVHCESDTRRSVLQVHCCKELVLVVHA